MNSSRFSILLIVFLSCISGCSVMSEEVIPEMIDCPKDRLQSRAIASVARSDRWQICQKDEDCVLVPGVCELKASNRMYAIDSACHGRKLARLAKCVPPTKKGQAKAVCRSGSCLAIY